MYLDPFAIQLLLYDKLCILHKRDRFLQTLRRSLAQHRGEAAKQLDALVAIVQAVVGVPQLMSDAFEVGARVEKRKRVGVEDGEDGGLLDRDDEVCAVSAHDTRPGEGYRPLRMMRTIHACWAGVVESLMRRMTCRILSLRSKR